MLTVGSGAACRVSIFALPEGVTGRGGASAGTEPASGVPKRVFSMSSRISPRMKLAAKAAVSLALLAYLGRNIGGAESIAVVRSVDNAFLVPCLVQMLLIPLLGGLRWQIILNGLGRRQPLTPLIWMFWGGMAFSQVLPTAVGSDIVRVWMAIRHGIDASDAVTSVLLDRGLMLLVLVAMVAVLAPIASAGAVPAWLPTLSWVLLAVGIAGLVSLPLIGRLLRRLPQRRLIGMLTQVIEGSLTVVYGRRVFPLLLICLLTNVNLCVGAWWLALAMHLSVPLAALLVVVPLAMLTTIIPISVGGWGVREVAMVALLSPLGVAKERALLFSIAFGLAIALTSVPGLAWLWLRTGRHSAAPGDVQAPASAPAAVPAHLTPGAE